MSSETFEYNGNEYEKFPTMEKLLEEAGLSKTHISRYHKKLTKAGYDSVESLYNINKVELKQAKFSDVAAKKLFVHIQLVKRQGGIARDFTELIENEGNYSYMTTGSTRLDEMLNYTNGRVGWRTSTMIELFGEAGMGKSQICMTAAAIALRSEEKGGLGRGVAYIDSEGAFEGSRFEYMARYWGVDPEFLKENLIHSRVSSFDEVELALTEIEDKLAGNGNDTDTKQDIGLIVVDSIMDPLQSQYPVGMNNLANLQPRQQHLTQVLTQLKNMCVNYNMVTLYTNHVQSNIEKYGPKKGPKGGHAMSHASDIRIYLSKPTNSQSKWMKKSYEKAGLKAGRAAIVDCGFLANVTGFYVVGPFGIGDPNEIKNLAKQADQVRSDGYLSVDAKGNKHENLHEDVMSRDEQLELTRELLYGN